MKKLYSRFMEKSIKQRVCICIVLVAVLTLLFFTIKANFFDIPTEATEQYESPQFHVSLVDMGLLLGSVTVYSIHKIREKRKQRRL